MNGSDPLLDDLLRGLVAGDSLAVVTEGNVDHIHTLNTGHLSIKQFSILLRCVKMWLIVAVWQCSSDMCDVQCS